MSRDVSKCVCLAEFPGGTVGVSLFWHRARLSVTSLVFSWHQFLLLLDINFFSSLTSIYCLACHEISLVFSLTSTSSLPRHQLLFLDTDCSLPWHRSILLLAMTSIWYLPWHQPLLFLDIDLFLDISFSKNNNRLLADFHKKTKEIEDSFIYPPPPVCPSSAKKWRCSRFVTEGINCNDQRCNDFHN